METYTHKALGKDFSLMLICDLYNWIGNFCQFSLKESLPENAVVHIIVSFLTENIVLHEYCPKVVVFLKYCRFRWTIVFLEVS